MLKIQIALALALGLMSASGEVAAATVSKCVINGVVTYQQGACPSGQARELPTIEELNAEESKRRASRAEVPKNKSGVAASTSSNGLRCDGRRHCSQMRSCEEAKYFLANCPGVEMDGDHNGIPCERQWCAR